MGRKWWAEVCTQFKWNGFVRILPPLKYPCGFLANCLFPTRPHPLKKWIPQTLQ